MSIEFFEKREVGQTTEVVNNTLEIKINNEGNVKFERTKDGLKGEVTFPASTNAITKVEIIGNKVKVTKADGTFEELALPVQAIDVKLQGAELTADNKLKLTLSNGDILETDLAKFVDAPKSASEYWTEIKALPNFKNDIAEFEVVTAYTEPQEDDDYYLEDATAKIRHKATGFITDVHMKEKKLRSTPVNESFVETMTATVQDMGDSVNIYVGAYGVDYTSNVDGARLSSAEDMSTTSLEVRKSEYTAKTFNTANVGKTFTITTNKRYAQSAGHPVVKPTEFHVPYPVFPYVERTVTPTVSTNHFMLNINLESMHELHDGSDDKLVREEIDRTVYNGKDKTFTVNYTIKKNDGTLLTGTHTFTRQYGFGRFQVADYGLGNDVKYQKWEFVPFDLEGFFAKITVKPQTYEEGTL